MKTAKPKFLPQKLMAVLHTKTRPDTRPTDATSKGRLLFPGLMFKPYFLTLFKPNFLTLSLKLISYFYV